MYFVLCTYKHCSEKESQASPDVSGVCGINMILTISSQQADGHWNPYNGKSLHHDPLALKTDLKTLLLLFPLDKWDIAFPISQIRQLLY